MFAIQRYVDENYEDHIYSEMLYAQGAVVGANLDCVKNYGDFGAKAILISGIIISFKEVIVPGTYSATFTDINGRILFVLTSAIQAPLGLGGNVVNSDNIFAEFWKILDGPQLFIRCNNINVNFSLAHQYLTVREKRWQDPSK